MTNMNDIVESLITKLEAIDHDDDAFGNGYYYIGPVIGQDAIVSIDSSWTHAQVRKVLEEIVYEFKGTLYQ